MSTTFTQSFTRTNAHYIATKIAGDLRQMSRFYGKPSEQQIEWYLAEITEYLAAGYLSSFEAGFRLKGSHTRVVTLKYEAREGAGLLDDRAGRVFAGADISGAEFFSFLTTNSAYDLLSASDKATFEKQLPISRTVGAEPTDGNGYWASDKSYSSGGGGTQRSTFRPS